MTMVFLGALVVLARTQQVNLKAAAHAHLGRNPNVVLAEIGRLLKGKVVMTNVYPTTASFFTQEAAFGSDGSVEPSRCHASFIRGHGQGVTVKPTHAVLFRGLFTGFTRCLDDCLRKLEAKLDARHDRALRTELFTIYALKEN